VPSAIMAAFQKRFKELCKQPVEEQASFFQHVRARPAGFPPSRFDPTPADGSTC